MKSKIRVMVVDEGCLRHSLLQRLNREGMQVQQIENLTEALDLVGRQWPHGVVLDTNLPQAMGIELLRRICKLDSSLRVVIATHSPNFREAIEVVKEAACDYLETSANNDEEVIEATCRPWSENHRVQDSCPEEKESRKAWSLPQVMGASQQVSRLTEEVAQVAPTNFSVVILGETGSGKELVARAIHARSPRAGRQFVSVDCGAIPESLIENELYGHERGSFTGADRMSIGKFEAASGGTLFLDEISNLPMGMQSKLLRVLQEKLIFRIGSTAGIRADVRLLSATNQNLASLIQVNAFRGDLFHRLSEYIIEVPPLRERREDILFLAGEFLKSTNRELGKQVQGFSDSAIDLLLTYDWPGNVRELRNIVRGAVLMADEFIAPEHLRLRLPGSRLLSASSCLYTDAQLSLKQILTQNTIQIERAVLFDALQRTGGNKAKAARMLGIDYKTIHTKIRRYGIQKEPTYPDPVKEP